MGEARGWLGVSIAYSGDSRCCLCCVKCTILEPEKSCEALDHLCFPYTIAVGLYTHPCSVGAVLGAGAEAAAASNLFFDCSVPFSTLLPIHHHYLVANPRALNTSPLW
eukprot:COSAG01_NODE_1038_length_11978_cov_4.983500_11_plen_108_part_00